MAKGKSKVGLEEAMSCKSFPVAGGGGPINSALSFLEAKAKRESLSRAGGNV